MSTDNDTNLAEYITADEAAVILRQRPSTLATWRYEKRGPVYFKAGRIVLYHPRDLASWLQSQRHEPAGV
jgi:Helix-turn-helix domain